MGRRGPVREPTIPLATFEKINVIIIGKYASPVLTAEYPRACWRYRLRTKIIP